MDMYNLDGSQVQCGKRESAGVAKYVYDHGIVDKTSFKALPQEGIKYRFATIRDGKASW